MAGDFNGHVGQHQGGIHGVHRSYEVSTHSDEETRPLKFCYLNELSATLTSGKPVICSPIDYKSNCLHSKQKAELWLHINVITFPGKESTSQHRVGINDFRLQARKIPRRKPVCKSKIWKLK